MFNAPRQIGECLILGEDLNGLHAEGFGRLQVNTQIINEQGRARVILVAARDVNKFEGRAF